MPTYPRPSSQGRLSAFGLVDTLTGLFLLAVTVALLASGVATVLTVERHLGAQWDTLIRAQDAQAYAADF